MKRSGFALRATPLRQYTAVEPKEKPCAYEKCGRLFVPHPSRPLANVCSPRCATRRAQDAVKAKEAAARAERKQDRERLEALKPAGKWLAECRKIVQAIARIRDRNDGCISCHMGPEYQDKWQGSHFRPAGNHSAVELHLWNIHKSCSQCNLHKGGNIAGYRPRLVEKIGADRVEWLESQNQVTKRTIEYLKRFKQVMGKRLRRMEKRIGN